MLTLRGARGLRPTTIASSRKARGWVCRGSGLWMNNFPTKAEAARKSHKKSKTKKNKAGKQTWNVLQNPGSTDMKPRETADTPARKIFEKADQPYKNVLVIPETGKVLLLKNSNYRVSLSIKPDLSQLRPMLCICAIVAVPGLKRGVILDPSCLDSIQQCDRTGIRSLSDSQVKVPGAIALHLCIGEIHTRLDFGLVTEFIVADLLGIMCTKMFIKLMYPAERKIVLYHCTPVPVLNLHEAGSLNRNDTSDRNLELSWCFALFVKRTRCEQKYITTVRYVLLSVMRETIVLVHTQATGLINLHSDEMMAKTHARMTVNGIVNVCPGPAFYITIVIFGRVEVSLPKD